MSRSWSSIRKQLEQDLLCEKLRGRVQYFFTHYRKSHDEEARVCVRVDGKEYVMGNAYNYYVKGYAHLQNEMKQVMQIPMRVWDFDENIFKYDEENTAVEEYIKKRQIFDGAFSAYQIMKSIEDFLQMNIDDAIQSDNLILKMLALLDRRIGKRRLQKMEEEMERQPDWLRFFYELRMEAEELGVLSEK